MMTKIGCQIRWETGVIPLVKVKKKHRHRPGTGTGTSAYGELTQFEQDRRDYQAFSDQAYLRRYFGPSMRWEDPTLPPSEGADAVE